MTKQFFFLLLLSQALSAQIPQNFEYLYHDNQFSELGATHIIDEGVLFVSHNRYRDMTVVALAKNDNTQEILFTSRFSSKSKVVITQDSTIHFLLYRLFDYDIGMSGFYDVAYNEKDNEVEVNSFIYGNESPVEEVYIDQVSIASSGNYLLITQEDELITFDGTDILEQKDSNSFQGVFVSEDGDVYYNTVDQVFKYFQGQFNSIVSVDNIIDIGQLDSYLTVLLKEGNVLLFDEDDELLNSFAVNQNINSLDQVGLIDSTFYTMTQGGGVLTVSKLNWAGEIFSESEIQLNDNELITAIDYLSDNNFLLKGRIGMSYENNYPQINNAFFRNVDILNSNTYEKTDVQILDFEVFQTGKDSFVNQIFEETNDTIWWVSYLYDVNCTLQNNTDKTITSAHIYHSRIFNNPGPTSLKLYELDSQVVNANDGLPLSVPGESFGGRQVLVDLELFLPGANHRFNLSENIISLPEFKSDVTALEWQNELIIYPNPTSDYLNFKSDLSINQVAIYNIQGQLILAQSGKNQIDKIDVSQLESGTYFLKTNQTTSKFIKK